MRVDTIIFGGGAAGAWLLDDLVRNGFNAILVEAHALGAGQTVTSQGIIHGGMKYTLSNLLDPSAQAIAQMPVIWRDCLAGRAKPDLSQATVRAEFCYLWSTGSAASMIGMTGARHFLRVKPSEVPRDHWPDALRGVRSVYRMDEQVIAPASFIAAVTRPHQSRLFKVDGEAGIEFQLTAPGRIEAVTLTEGGRTMTVQPGSVVFTAGEGNAHLRTLAGLGAEIMQRRPLHMVMARGNLPVLNGHCTDFNKTRVTITSDVDSRGSIVWQVGGQVSEVGVDMDANDLIAHTGRELSSAIPGISLAGVSWATYRVNRAEAATGGGLRPSDARVIADGNTLTCWPTKLALAPRLAEMVRDALGKPAGAPARDTMPPINEWRRPVVALPPWELAQQWCTGV